MISRDATLNGHVLSRLRRRALLDRLSAAALRMSVASVHVLAVLMAGGLLIKSWPILSQKPLLALFGSANWHPLKGEFGLFAFVIGTVEVTALSMAIAVPICLLSAIFLSEYAPRRLREIAHPAIDLLAGIPSVVYGLFGVMSVVPTVRWLGRSIGISTSGYCLLSGAIVLAIMVFPVIISVSIEVLRAVPLEAREVALALGATRWEVVKHVIVRSSMRGLVAALVLGFARAAGETMAVLMVVGNVAQVPSSVFMPVYPLPALIANNYGEMMSIPLYDSALMLVALVLFLAIAAFNIAARLTLLQIERSYSR